ncbi:MAG: insulinase family protein [Planctomycetaceae bacterium]|nr:insulinase family protein [Planctomycetaceae bacterium]
MEFHQATLNNGLEVIAETNPRAHSAAVGFFVRAGARDESLEVSGVSHFLEHMAFKGNERFTADDINRVFDEVGAKYNASTSEEVTLFYAAILPEYLPRTFDLLVNLLRPALREEDFALEQQVILEEIGMYEDAPTFQAYDLAMQTHFDRHPLGRRILGTSESVGALTAQQMRAYFVEHYRAGNITLVGTGNLQWEELLQMARESCAAWPAGKSTRDLHEALPAGGTAVIERATHQQQHVMQLAPAPASTDALRYAAEILSVIVGDDSGSRLYWELVDPGEAEAAELAYNDYGDSGCWCTYLSCAPEATRENLERIHELYADVNERLVTAEELEQARNKVATRVVLASERPMGRLSALGGNWVYRQEYRTVEDDLRTVQELGLKDIRELLSRYPLTQTTTVGVGPLRSIPMP